MIIVESIGRDGANASFPFFQGNTRGVSFMVGVELLNDHRSSIDEVRTTSSGKSLWSSCMDSLFDMQKGNTIRELMDSVCCVLLARYSWHRFQVSSECSCSST